MIQLYFKYAQIIRHESFTYDSNLLRLCFRYASTLIQLCSSYDRVWSGPHIHWFSNYASTMRQLCVTNTPKSVQNWSEYEGFGALKIAKLIEKSRNHWNPFSFTLNHSGNRWAEYTGLKSTQTEWGGGPKSGIIKKVTLVPPWRPGGSARGREARPGPRSGPGSQWLILGVDPGVFMAKIIRYTRASWWT